MMPGWNDENEILELDDEEEHKEDMIHQWIEDRYNELIEKHGPQASGGPCHVSLDDGNYQCLADDTDMAAYAIVRVLVQRFNLRGMEEYMCNLDLYDDYPIDMLFDTYLTMKNIVDTIGPAKLNQL